MSKPLKNLKETAKCLGVTPKTLRRQLALCGYECVRVGRQMLFDPEDVKKALKVTMSVPEAVIEKRPAKKNITGAKHPDRDFYRRELGLR